MSTEPTIRKIVQVAEEARTPIHVPVLLGNECYVVTQQDVRRVEDMRLYSYSKMNAKGELVPVEAIRNNPSAQDALLNAVNCQMQLQQHHNDINILTEFLNRTTANSALQQALQQQSLQAQQPPQTGLFQPSTMQIPNFQCNFQSQQQIPTMTLAPPPNTDRATLQQQLNWTKAGADTITTFPLHRTSATSTTDISHLQHLRTRRNACFSRGCNTMDVDEMPLTSRSATCINRGNTSECLSAREQLKQRKITRFFS